VTPRPASALPPLREVVARYEIAARRRLGQHFLFDLNITARIARAAGPLTGRNVIEVGPGPGGLTRALLDDDARHVYAVERDPRCVAALADVAEAYAGRLTVIEGDALSIDWARLAPPPRIVVANLPYNIATVLLTTWLHAIDAFESLTLMFQREVAERLLAAPGTKDYGRLSVLTQWLAEPRLLFGLPPTAFTPPPKVHSSVVRFTPRPAPLAPAGIATLERVTAAAFGQRRKMLRASLRRLEVDTARLLDEAGIVPTARAEELTVQEFCALARALDAQSGASAPHSTT
jgi:16S rRNA (adenine1518-N6/adenine1519-N6)-dimethyltransferase